MLPLRYLYLHGFASSPRSTKCRYFLEQLTARGITPVVPDLNVPSFQEMTLSSQIDHVGSIVDCDETFVAIGSSMGGLVATLSATRFSNIRALLLLAPGFGIEKRWVNLVDDDRRCNWKAKGAIHVFHYASGNHELLNYQFVEDLESYDTRNIRVSVPTMILHGIND
ncbi:MAG: alpha/beta fold hydrolase, partial [Candidatus Obscuribacterales bacterium]|nr:alpha/beta fold hydrolase [Candidatus Obscuribacterales bacterium]